ncbi:DNA-processing protein DprA [Eubacteriaceae bacterium ES3]|nr:DNA-processing protein DprA [Eubacteriaceae bacterium ES3]
MDGYENRTRNLLALTQIAGLGRKRIKKLVFIAEKKLSFIGEIIESGIKSGIIKTEISKQNIEDAINAAEKILDQNDRYGIKSITYLENDFPEYLQYEDGPLIIYYLGELSSMNCDRRVAVIGSRKPERLGYDFAYMAARQVVLKKGIVISGLATGCDSAGHRGALAENGKTVAFLPSGLLNIYPAENQKLADQILDLEGGLVTEYPLQTEPLPYRFVERDRLQAAASQIVIVSSFSERSGTIQTLKYAHAYQRPIYTLKDIVSESPSGFKKLNTLEIDYSVLKFSNIIDVLNHL